jgi:anti-sigma regulatory factor (Ser/Thr protein kinase)
VTQPALEPELRLKVPAAPENVALARQAVTGLCEAIGVEPRIQEDVRLAVTEACTNVVVHAYGADAEDRPLALEATVEDGELLVIVRDQGRGMGVFTESSGLGLGLPLIAALTTMVEMRASPGTPGTEVVMTFTLEGSMDA